MQRRAFWKAVALDRAGFLDQFLALLRDQGARFCVVGGQAVNAYVDPVVSLDLDLVVTLSDLARLEPVLAERFIVEHFPHSIDVAHADSDLRVQIQTDPRYEDFLAHAAPHDILGVRLPVARVEDVLRGKVALDCTPAVEHIPCRGGRRAPIVGARERPLAAPGRGTGIFAERGIVPEGDPVGQRTAAGGTGCVAS